jgi:uncharacterized protein (DUF305 family)
MSIEGGRVGALLLVLGAGIACRASESLRPPIVQPGAPGEPSRTVTADEAVELARTRTSSADVRFMQRMIAHHAQALEMTALLRERTTREDMRLLARRIELSQADEIRLMRSWLRARGQEFAAAHDHDAMPGMLRAEEMMRLAQAHGDAFDRLFLELMIKHHDGALTMVNDLFASPGAAEDSEIFSFASDVEADQRMEIRRMSAMFVELAR